MNVIITEKQEERIKSSIIEIVEDIKVPLAIKVDVVFSSTGTIYVLIPLKNYLMSAARAKYESIIRDKIKNYIGLNVEVIMMEKTDI
jgi:hypothetical protein